MTMHPGPETQPRPRHSRYPWVLVATCLVLLLLPLPHPPRSGWIPLLWNWAHIPLFAGVAWVLMVRLGESGSRTALVRTAATVIVLAAGSELLQTWTSRSPEWNDILSDLVGAGMGICFAAGVARKAPARGALWFAVAAALLIFGARPLISHARAVAHKHAILPLLEDFESTRTTELWFLERSGRLEAIELAEATVRENGHELRISLSPPGLASLHYDGPSQDWSRFGTLSFDCRLDSGHPVELGVRIDSASNAPRVKLGVLLQPGQHRVAIALRPSPSSPQPQALRKVDQLVLFFEGTNSDGSLALDNLRLE